MNLLEINKIIKSESNCRNNDIDYIKVDYMVDSLNKGDILPPILCRPSLLKNGYYEVIQGQHRLEAHKKFGSEYIQSYIKDLTDKEAIDTSIRENIGRSTMKHYQIWNNCSHLYINSKDKKDIADIMNISLSTCHKYIRIGYFLNNDIKIQLKKHQTSLALLLSSVHPDDQINIFNKLKGLKKKYINDEYDLLFQNKKFKKQPNEIKNIKINKKNKIEKEKIIKPLIHNYKLSIDNDTTYLNKEILIQLQETIKDNQDLNIIYQLIIYNYELKV